MQREVVELNHLSKAKHLLSLRAEGWNCPNFSTLDVQRVSLNPSPAYILLVLRVYLNQNSNLLYKYTKNISYIQGKKQLFLLFFQQGQNTHNAKQVKQNNNAIKRKEPTASSSVLYFFLNLVISLFIILFTIYGVILINITINCNFFTPSNPINPYYIIHITHNYSTNIRNIPDISKEIPNFFSFIFFSQHFCSHPATLKDTKFFPHIQINQVTICQAGPNYDIFNEIELLLKNPYITALPY